VDPCIEEDESWSPYNYVRNNPIAQNDPDGRFWNFVVGAVVGAAVDYAGQVTANMISGDSFVDALTDDISVGSILVSAGEGLITSGGSVLGKAAETAAKTTLKTIAKEGVKEGVKAATGKALDNVIKGKDVTEGVIQEGTIGAATSLLPTKKSNFGDKQNVVNKLESKSNPTHRQQTILKTAKTDINNVKTGNVVKSVTNFTVASTTSTAVSKKKDEKK
jgi:hypothetical protein